MEGLRRASLPPDSLSPFFAPRLVRAVFATVDPLPFSLSPLPPLDSGKGETHAKPEWGSPPSPLSSRRGKRGGAMAHPGQVVPPFSLFPSSPPTTWP